MNFDDQTKQSYLSVNDLLLQQRAENGHWIGELSSSALSTATAVSAMAFWLKATGNEDPELQSQIQRGIDWLLQQQNRDGGFGDTPLSLSNISTTLLAIAALHACGRQDEFSREIETAWEYVDQQGGIEGLKKRYGSDKTFAVPILAHCAMAGIVPWREVSALPFEASCVPQRFYNLVQMPVVSYAVPALVAIGQVKFHCDPPWDPIRRTIRKLAVKPSLKVLQRMQPASGGYLEAVPLTSFVVMGLVQSGQADHSVVTEGIRFLRESFRPPGSWPIDTNLATWGTTLAVNAIANDPNQFQDELAADPQVWENCLQWILACQNQTRHPFTGADPGGWGWTDLSGAVPDADDTPGALIAIRNFYDHAKLTSAQRDQIAIAARKGCRWLIDLQNRDSGWPTFCKGWGKFPFDRSGADITAHVLRGLLAWENDFPDLPIRKSIDKGFRYLDSMQQPDGSWLPLWFGNQDAINEANPWYGTAKVLMSYRDAKLFDTEAAKRGLNWVVAAQNEEGGWGGGKSLQWPELFRNRFRTQPDPEIDQLGSSSVEETALCVEILVDAMTCDVFDENTTQIVHQAVGRGIQWLNLAVETGCISIQWPIGLYFAKLWYHEKLYPLVFSASALAKANHWIQSVEPGTVGSTETRVIVDSQT